MYKEHSDFKSPSNKYQKIWRYLDFAKFVSMLLKGSLYFCRVDLFDDPFEGSISRVMAEARAQLYDDLRDDLGLPDVAIDGLRQWSTETNRDIRKVMFVNSWNMSDYESPALWSLYSRDSKSIAIQSTFQRFVDSLYPASLDIHIGIVSYIDYDTERISAGTIFTPILHKRKTFEYEQEIRAAVLQFPTTQTETADNGGAVNTRVLDIDTSPIRVANDIPDEMFENTRGILVNVSLDTLIERIYVSPTSPDWFKDLVIETAAKLGLAGKEVHQSCLANKPIF